MIHFATRNFKEIIRDPLSIIFSILLPLFLLFIFQQIEIPNEVYDIEYFAPAIVIFSFSFISMFTAILVSKDRTTSLLIRLSVSPLKGYSYIGGYIISLLPLVLLQNVLFYLVGLWYGLEFSISVILSILISLPLSILFILLGILIGSLANEKAASGVSSVVVQLVCFTSGMYFSSDMISKEFALICKLLPFEASLDIVKSVLNNTYEHIILNVIIVSVYIIFVFVLTIFVFNKKKIK